MMPVQQSQLKNSELKKYTFLKDMYADDYFPDNLVDKCKDILIELCLQIEQHKPARPEDLYPLTHAATEKFNELQDEFYAADSEIETVARDCIGTDFEFIAKTYGYEADVEELIAPREW